MQITPQQFKHVISLISLVGVFSLIGLLEIKAIPPDNKDVVNISLGALIGGLITRIGGHYFPSSAGGKTDKDNGSTTV